MVKNDLDTWLKKPPKWLSFSDELHEYFYINLFRRPYGRSINSICYAVEFYINVNVLKVSVDWRRYMARKLRECRKALDTTVREVKH